MTVITLEVTCIATITIMPIERRRKKLLGESRRYSARTEKLMEARQLVYAIALAQISCGFGLGLEKMKLLIRAGRSTRDLTIK